MLKPALLALSAALIAGAALAAAAPAPVYAVTGSIAGPDGGWDLLSIDQASQTLFVARSGGVMRVDLASSAVTPNVVVSNRGHDALVIPGAGRVLSSSGADNTVTLFDEATGKVIATLPTGTKPDAETWDPATRTAWVMTPGSGGITVVDPVGAKVIDTINVGGSLELGAADGKGLLFVNVEDRNEVVVLDTRSRKILRRFPLAGCDGPTGIAYAPDSKLILSACANGVAIVSALDGRQVASLKIGPRADGAVYDVRRKLAFVPSGGDGTLAVIRLSGVPAVVATVQTAKGARTVALDEKSGSLYLPSAQYLPAVGEARPAMVPGSFKVLIVSPAAP